MIIPMASMVMVDIFDPRLLVYILISPNVYFCGMGAIIRVSVDPKKKRSTGLES